MCVKWFFSEVCLEMASEELQDVIPGWSSVEIFCRIFTVECWRVRGTGNDWISNSIEKYSRSKALKLLDFPEYCLFWINGMYCCCFSWKKRGKKAIKMNIEMRNNKIAERKLMLCDMISFYIFRNILSIVKSSYPRASRQKNG